MAHTFKPAPAATVAAKLISDDAILSSYVSKNDDYDLMAGGKGGQAVTLQVPVNLFARDRAVDDVTNPIVLDEITEETVTFNLDKRHVYSAVGLSEADLTLNLKDFSAQVLKPQAVAVADDLDYRLATKLQSVAASDVDYDEANPVKTFTAVRKILRDRGVPATGLVCLAGTKVYADLLDAKAITDVSESGSDAALRDASAGRVRGFNITETNRLDEEELIFFQRDAVVLISRAPVAPLGASYAATVNEAGFQLRYLRDYDARFTQDRSILSTFVAVGFMPTFKITRDNATRTATRQRFDDGGVIRIDTAAA